MDANSQITHNHREMDRRPPVNGVYEFDSFWRDIPVICRVTVQLGAARKILALIVEGRSMQHDGYEMFDVSELLERDEEYELLDQFNPAKASYVTNLEGG